MGEHDIFVLSKGHSVGALYISHWATGRLPEPLLRQFHQDGSKMAGHPPPRWIPEIPLDAGDFSLIDRRVISWLLNCPERDLFVRGLRAYVGFKQTGVDYVRPERMFGLSTNSLIKNIEWAKKGIFSFSNTPLTMLTTIGVVLFGVSLLAAFVARFATADYAGYCTARYNISPDHDFVFCLVQHLRYRFGGRICSQDYGRG